MGFYCSNKCQRMHQKKDFSELKTDKSRKARVVEAHGYNCSTCGINEWNGREIGLELDHIDGDSYNNSFSNLRLLCPNCHSQTPTFKNKNKGRGRKSRK